MAIFTTLAIGSGLVVAGMAAGGYLAHGISQALQGAGRVTHFNTVDEVSASLQSIGRPDLAYNLNYEVARGNTAAFNAQSVQAGSLSGQISEIMQLAPWLLFGYVAIKAIK